MYKYSIKKIKRCNLSSHISIGNIFEETDDINCAFRASEHYNNCYRKCKDFDCIVEVIENSNG